MLQPTSARRHATRDSFRGFRRAHAASSPLPTHAPSVAPPVRSEYASAFLAKILDNAELAFDQGDPAACTRWCKQVLERSTVASTTATACIARAYNLLARCEAVCGNMSGTLACFAAAAAAHAVDWKSRVAAAELVVNHSNRQKIELGTCCRRPHARWLALKVATSPLCRPVSPGGAEHVSLLEQAERHLSEAVEVLSSARERPATQMQIEGTDGERKAGELKGCWLLSRVGAMRSKRAIAEGMMCRASLFASSWLDGPTSRLPRMSSVARRRKMPLTGLRAASSVERLCQYPPIWRVSDFLTADECAHLIRCARPQLEASVGPPEFQLGTQCSLPFALPKYARGSRRAEALLSFASPACPFELSAGLCRMYSTLERARAASARAAPLGWKLPTTRASVASPHEWRSCYRYPLLGCCKASLRTLAACRLSPTGLMSSMVSTTTAMGCCEGTPQSSFTYATSPTVARRTSRQRAMRLMSGRSYALPTRPLRTLWHPSTAPCVAATLSRTQTAARRRRALREQPKAWVRGEG